VNINEFIETRSKPFLIISALVLLLLVAFLDYLSGIEVSFSLFYLMPISMAAWFVNRNIGIILAVLGGMAWYYVDLLGGHQYSSWFVPYWNAMVRFGFFIVVVMSLSRLKKAFEVEQILSRTDPLTGAVNTRYFYELASLEIDRSRRYGHQLAFAYLDIDNFKQINDEFGHKAGDDLLRLFAEIITQNKRSVDVFARLGGDEFVVLMPETGLEAAQTVMDKIQNLLTKGMRENHWPVTFSIGAITFNSLPQSVDEMIIKADKLMYSVKASGKNRTIYETFDTEKAQ
jgi:diguanylate cyclase (GGDEF)-like protein